MKYKSFCFDLDGVIIDSLPVMKIAWEKVSNDFNLNISFKKYKQHIGISFSDILKKLEIDCYIHQKVKNLYDIESQKNIDKVTLYPKVVEALSKLNENNLKCAILTSKTKYRAIEIIKKFKLEIFFSEIICPEDLTINSTKPSPKGLLEVAKRFELNTSQIVYFGDMRVDYLCASNANVDYCHCKYGYDSYFDYQIQINSFIEILNFLK